MIKELTAEQQEVIEEVEKDCNIELAWYFKNETPGDIDDVIEYCEERISEIEVIYYATAMKYLSENDISLSESIGIAIECGIPLENINSELLATLLQQREAREALYEHREALETAFFSS